MNTFANLGSPSHIASRLKGFIEGYLSLFNIKDLFAWMTLITFCTIFIHSNQLLIPLIGIVAFYLLLIRMSTPDKSHCFFLTYLRYSFFFFFISIIGALSIDFSLTRLLFSYTLFMFPPLLGFLYLLSNITVGGFRKLMLYFTIVQLIVFSYQFFSSIIFGTFLLGSDQYVGTIGRAGVTAHTAGVVMSLTGIYWLSLFFSMRDNRKLHFIFFMTTTFCSILTATTHAYFSLILAVALSLFTRARHKFRIAFCMTVFLLVLISFNPAVQHGVDEIERVLTGEYTLHERIYKAYAYTRGIEFLIENPFNLIFGVGLGNYNDRVAGFALFKRYGQTVSRYIELKPSTLSSTLIGKWFGKTSVVNSIHSDNISVLIELGLLGTTIYILMIYNILKPFRNSRMMNFAFVYIFYLIFLGCFDNWLQYPQASAFFSLLLFDLYRRINVESHGLTPETPFHSGFRGTEA